MDTILANLKYAIRNKETITIGGGDFSANELKEVVAALEAAQARAAALQEIVTLLENHPEAKEGNSKVHYCVCKARSALKGER